MHKPVKARTQIPNTVLLFFLLVGSSCSAHHATYLQQWSETLRPGNTVAGRYQNITTAEAQAWEEGATLPETPHLWTLLTGEDARYDDIIVLEMKVDRLYLTREVGGSVVDVRDYKVRHAPDHLRLATQYHARLTKAIVVWFFGQDDFAVGTTLSGNLSLYHTATGMLVVGFFPITAGGGGPGIVYEFGKADE